MIKCPSGHKLDDDYVGLYCLYCKQPVALIENAEGQLALRRVESNHPQKYLAVIYKEKQRGVVNVEVTNENTEIRFDNDEFKDDLKTHQVLMAFQDPEEKLAIN